MSNLESSLVEMLKFMELQRQEDRQREQEREQRQQEREQEREQQFQQQRREELDRHSQEIQLLKDLIQSTTARPVSTTTEPSTPSTEKQRSIPAFPEYSAGTEDFELYLRRLENHFSAHLLPGNNDVLK